MGETEQLVTEEMVRTLVDRFYTRAHADPLLGPFFAAAITDWPEHLQSFRAFWSRVLRGTDGYRGCVMGVHGRLQMKPAHFERWLALFEDSARQTLPPEGVDRAMEVAKNLDQRLRRFAELIAAQA